jgi:hypothetical protein
MVVMEGGTLQWVARRVSREAHARICERLGVRFPGPTRPQTLGDVTLDLPL